MGPWLITSADFAWWKHADLDNSSGLIADPIPQKGDADTL